MKGKKSNIEEMTQVIMGAEDRRGAFRDSLLKIGDEERASLVVAVKAAIDAEKEAVERVQKEQDELQRIENELFGQNVVISGNHRADSKGKQLTLALERGATMEELKQIRGAVPQHFSYLKRHGFTITLKDNVYRAFKA